MRRWFLEALLLALATGSPIVAFCTADDVAAHPRLQSDGNEVDSPQSLRDAIEHTPPSDRKHHEQLMVQLSVQAALREATRFVGSEQFREAVERLEPLVAHANGSAEFLDTLAAAYSGRIQQLLGEQKYAEARLLSSRLGVLTANGVVASGTTATPAASDATTSRDAPQSASSSHASTASIARAEPQSASARSVNQLFAGSLRNFGEKVRQTTSSVIPTIRTVPSSAVTAERGAAPPSGTHSQLAQADRLYEAGQFADASGLYDVANRSGLPLQDDHKKRWGYCIGFQAYQRYEALRQKPAGSVAPEQWAELEAQLQRSVELRPSAEFRSWANAALLQVAQQKRWSGAQVAEAGRATLASQNFVGWANQRIEPRGFGNMLRSAAAWETLETENFIIQHRNRALAEEVGQIAEHARRFSHEKWFGNEPLENWVPKCHVVLYPTSQEYTQATGVGPQSPGHSRFSNEGGRITSRRLDVRADDPTMKVAVLPHEITHVVLAGRFGSSNVPRWADEGMAVLTEPDAQRQAHLANLLNSRNSGQFFRPSQIMTLADYPAGGQLREFYAHSVGICHFLVERGGPQRLVAFLRVALLRNDYEAALRQVYGFADFVTLEDEFERHLAGLNQSRAAPLAAAR